MRKFVGPVMLAVAAGIVTVPGLADPDRIVFPAGYVDNFVLYNIVDRLDRNVVRFMYVSPDSHVMAAGGAPAPDGSILIMEDHPAQMDADGNPVLGPDGRLVAGDAVTNVFVMEKQPGWGDSIPADLRNGDWDYAWFLADGEPKQDAGFEGCFTCHANRAASDFTFTYSNYLLDRDAK